VLCHVQGVIIMHIRSSMRILVSALSPAGCVSWRMSHLVCVLGGAQGTEHRRASSEDLNQAIAQGDR
jgi:hypothetical protein